MLAQRSPTLLLRFAGALLLRFAARRLSASLLKEPPRFTRLELLPRKTDLFPDDWPRQERG